MKPRTLIWLCLVGCTGVFGALGVWQHSRAAGLRAERDRLVARQLERARAAAPRGDATETENELAHLRRQHEEWVRAREGLATIERALASENGEIVAPPSSKARHDVPPPLRGPMVKNGEWRNAGAASPEAALESFVWAATRGETEALGQLLAIDTTGRRQLADVFGQLSNEARASYGSPENMLATLIAVQVPQDLSAIGPVNSLNLSNGDIALRTRLERDGVTMEDVELVFRLADGHWQLVVPREIASGAVAAALKTSAPPRR